MKHSANPTKAWDYEVQSRKRFRIIVINWLILFFAVMLFCEPAYSSDLKPVAVITSDEEVRVITASKEVVHFHGYDSYDRNGNGYLTQYHWYVNGIWVSGSASYEWQPGLPAGQAEKSFEIKLRVRDNSGNYASTTQTYTVKKRRRIYYLTDHLGSVRVSVTEDGQAIGYDDYYPFGAQMPGRSYTSGTPTKEKFTGKERDTETGLDYFGARYYDSSIGRWLAIDPKASKYPAWSPYNYTMDNPLNLIDPDGMSALPPDDIIVKQVENDDKSSAESLWLIYPTGTFDDVSMKDLENKSVDEITKEYGKPKTTRSGSSLPDDVENDAVVKAGKYKYEKGKFRSGQDVLFLDEGNGLGTVATTKANKNQGGKKIATGVAAHAGKTEWQIQVIQGEKVTKPKGSEGCPVCVSFGSLYENIESTGNFIIIRSNDD